MKDLKTLVVAIDGPAGSGKSTVARTVADRLKLVYLDTGAMYRAVTLKAIRKGIAWDDHQALIQLAMDTRIDVTREAGHTGIFMDGEDVTESIRTSDVTRACSTHVAGIPGIRHHLVKRQKLFGRHQGVVSEGRDTTTIVFPDADLRIYLDADFDERVRRRHKELQAVEPSIGLMDVQADLKQRDFQDRHRTQGALKIAKGAYRIDTTGLSAEDVADRIVLEIYRRYASRYSFFYSVSHVMVWILLKIFYRFRAMNAGCVPSTGGVILAANHSSYLDPPVVGGAVLSRQIHYLARESLFKNKLFGWMIRDFHSIPIKRASVDTDAFENVISVLKGGGAVLIFPEGTRTATGELQPAKRGIGYLAIMAAVPIVPVFVDGTYQALPKGAMFPRLSRITVRFGALIDIRPYLSGARDKATFQLVSNEVMKQIHLLKAMN